MHGGCSTARSARQPGQYLVSMASTVTQGNDKIGQARR